MAKVAKTAFYAWNTATSSINPASLISGNQFYRITGSMGSKMLYFPETSSRDFKSIGLEISFRQCLTSTFDIFGFSAELQLEGASPFTVSSSATIVNTAEHISLLAGPLDFTNYFNTNYNAASSSLSCSLNIYASITSSLGAANTGSAFRNFTAKLVSTYEHEDTDTKYLKTAIIPFNSPADSIATSLTTYGTIPKLSGSGGFLPEAGVTIRDYFFEIEGNYSVSTATDLTLQSCITSSTYSATNTFGTMESALISDTYDRFIWAIPTSSLPNLEASHSFQMALNSSGYRHIPSTMYVTYEYDKTNTTRLLNTLLVPQYIQSPLGATVEESQSFASRTFKVLDSNLELKDSAFRMYWNDISSIGTLNVKVGNQTSYGSYVDGGSTICGGKSIQHIISTSSLGEALTLTRGDNTISVQAYGTSTVLASNVNGLYIINYHSDVPANGIDYATKYHIFNTLEFQNVGVTTTAYSSNPPLSVTGSTYAIGQGVLRIAFGAGSNGFTYTTKRLANEGINGLGYVSLYDDALLTDAEIGSYWIVMGYGEGMGRYNEAPSLIYANPYSNRRYRFYQILNNRFGLQGLTNLSRYTYPLSGSIYGYTGDGSGYTVNIYNASDDALLFTLTTTVGGLFNTTWYDDTNLMYAKVNTGTENRYSLTQTTSNLFTVYLGNYEYGSSGTN